MLLDNFNICISRKEKRVSLNYVVITGKIDYLRSGMQHFPQFDTQISLVSKWLFLQCIYYFLL